MGKTWLEGKRIDDEVDAWIARQIKNDHFALYSEYVKKYYNDHKTMLKYDI